MAKKKVTKKVTTKKDVAVVAETELVEGSLSSALNSLVNVDTSSLGEFDKDISENMDLFKNDILIPKIQLVQSMSEARKDKKADEGDYINSRTQEILLGVDNEDHLPIIIIKTFKRVQTFEIVKNGNDIEKVFISSEIMTTKNANVLYQETSEGKDLVRREVISCYAITGEDAQKGIIKPYIIDFAATSKGAGRNLVSDINVLNTDQFHAVTGELVRSALPSWVGWFKLSKAEEANGKNEYFVKTMNFGGVLPNVMWPFLKTVNEQVKALMQNDAVEIDDSDLHSSAKAGAKAETNVVGKASAAGDDV